ncbi:TMV resistance protein N [Vitis vinifera]|nr:TMV resistance protein N [Vitis vinifera]
MMKSYQEEKRLQQNFQKAIEESRICLIILSENYARSRRCLEELTKIMDCREQIGKLVFPIFYHVEPLHVREQIRSFGEALADHERNADHEEGRRKIEKRRATLTMVAGITGWWLKNR